MSCDCNNYSLLTAHTGILTISAAAPSLINPGTLSYVIAGAANGTIIRSITIKAIAPVSDGMIRLFIRRNSGLSFLFTLYREVIITETPDAFVVPIPTPQYTMFEAVLLGDLQLKSGEALVASTQNADTFNIIAEEVDWSYPNPAPATGNGNVSVATAALDGSGTIQNIFAAGSGANGATIKSVVIKALQSTHEGMVRLFISPDGSTWSLMREVWIPQTTQSAFEPSFKQVLDMNFKLEAGYSIGASTQNAEGFAITVEATNWAYPDPSAIYSRTLTIDHTLCGSSDSIDFPVLVSIQDDTLKTTPNGGHVATTNGYDILFFSDSGETTLLNWEMEFYDGVTGTLIAWVKIPTVSSSTDTVFYMQYGNVLVTTFRGGAAGSAWNSSYRGVWHFPDGTILSAADATTNANTGSITAAVASTGIIDGGAVFAGSSHIAIPNSTNYDSVTGTWSIWFNTSQSVSGVYPVIMARASSGSQNGITISLEGTVGCIFIQIYGTSFSGYEADNASIAPIAAYNDGNWHYVVFTFDGTNAPVLYVDGAATTYSGASPSSWSFNAQEVRTGKTLDPFWGQYEGMLDEMHILNTELSADWITTEYNNQSDPGNIGVAGFMTYGGEF